MPSRWASLFILIYWSIAAFCLLTWDIIPEWTLGSPPDLRTITLAADSQEPVRWKIQVIDDPKAPDIRRTVGEAVTSSSRKADEWVELKSHVEFDAGGLLKGSPFGTAASVQMKIASAYHVDPSGNLNSFELEVASPDSNDPLVKVTGQLNGANMEIVSRGPVPLLNLTRTFHYEPRSVVRDVLGPLDRLPGLHVGQRWETRLINPFSGQVDMVRFEVKQLRVINWEGHLVTTFEVEQRMSALSSRTWVRTDGLILRQEVPLPFVRLTLERRDRESTARKAPTPRAGS